MADEDPLSAHRLDKAKQERKGGAEKVKRSARTPESIEKELNDVYDQYLAETDPVRRKNLRDGALDLARQLKEVAVHEDSKEHRQRFFAVAEKVERPEPKPLSRAQELRLAIGERKRRVGAAAEAAELRHKQATGLKGGRPMISPEDRERFDRLFSRAAPKAKEEPKKEGPTPAQAAAGVAARHVRRRQIEKASQPAPRHNVRTPKLHVKKSGLPKLTKGKNVKLQVPSGKLPRTQQVRNILNRSH